MTAEIQSKIQDWLKSPFDEKTQKEVHALQESDPKALEDAFYSDLSFGTGGLRGLIGVGTNRLNIYTIRKATKGLANYLHKKFPSQEISVVIGFDSRIHSKEFAKEAADTLSRSQIKVFLLKELRPTPYVSFACRHFKSNAAIMITASHNPKEYNGYKVYWQDGAQVVAPHDVGILEEIEKIKDYSQEGTENQTLIESPGIELDRAYFEAIRPLNHFPEETKKSGKDLKIVYTSLHGTGQTMIPQALKEWGFTSLSLVEKQIIPDGTFPTVKFPNPEYPETLQMGIDLLMRSGGDLLLATDPDADRLGVVIHHLGKPVILTGNEIAALCVEYLCRILKEQNTLPKNGAFVTTIVTTDLLLKIAKTHQIACFEVLTGFKYIGEKIHLWETSSPKFQFIFGAEESYGYLLGTHARDKDGIISCCLLSEMALHLKKQEKTLVDFLHEVYHKYGLYKEKQLSLSFPPGKDGMESMQKVMDAFRKSPPNMILGQKIVSLEDYLVGKRHNLITKTEEPLELPESDVLLFRLEDESKLVIRPSGTEPKLKIYAGVCISSFNSLEEAEKKASEKLDHLLKSIESDLR